MSVLDILAREHALILALLDRLEHAFRLDEAAARREAQSVLLVLIPALERHEKIENLVFSDPIFRKGKAKQLAAELAREHRRLDGMRSQMLEALRDAWKEPIALARETVKNLASSLHAQFADEEQRLWPACRGLVSRSISHSLENAAARELRRLEADLETRRELIADYVGRDA